MAREQKNTKSDIKKIQKFLDEQKCNDIEIINISDKKYMVDSVILCTALNAKHTIACGDKFKKTFKNEIFKLELGDNWSVIDLGDVFVHIMTQEARNKYNLEEFLHSL